MYLMNTSVGLTAALLAATALTLSSCGSTPAPTPPTQEEVARGAGQAECEKQADEYLHSPGSAVYEWEDETGSDMGGAVKMRATVDSQNGFGAMIRSHVVCYVWVEGERVKNVDAKVTKSPQR